ncbi:MAG: hypothetical protein LBB53_01070 [Prevotellaceae bacterium]|jgi:hypothetical protein|nr:hypothetical protein [Prevotellaceae bacterium]
MITAKTIKQFIYLTYPFIDKKDLSELVAKAGYQRAGLDIDFVYSLADNPAFMAGYAQLFEHAKETRAWKEAVDTGQLNFAEGETGKKGTVYEWFQAVTSFLLGGASAYNDIKNGSSTYQSKYLISQQEALKAAQTTKIVIAIVVCVIVTTLIVVVYKGMKK